MIDTRALAQEVQDQLLAAMQRGQEQMRKSQEQMRKSQEQMRKSRERAQRAVRGRATSSGPPTSLPSPDVQHSVAEHAAEPAKLRASARS